MESAQNSHRVSVEFVGFCKVSCDMYHIYWFALVDTGT